MFGGQRSWFALIIWAILAVEVARLIAFLSEISRDPGIAASPTPQSIGFSVLKHDFPSGTSILAALMLQGAVFSSIADQIVLAGLFYLVGTVTLSYRSFQMFREMSTLNGNFGPRTGTILLTTTLLTIFAWLPYIFVTGGSGIGGNVPAGAGSANSRTAESGGAVRKQQRSSQGDSSSVLARLQSLFATEHSTSRRSSFAVARHILDSSLSPLSNATSPRQTSRQNTNIAITMPVTGPIFPGVELYPEAQPPTRLVAPAFTNPAGPGNALSGPLSIPFDGVYWFWRGPSDQPPLNSVVMHGSPSARFFRSTDGDGMSMEARQNLGFVVDPKRYRSIEVDIQNSDPFPNSVSILLKIRNTTIPGKPIQTLGMEQVSVPASSAESGPRRQTLRFHIPVTIAMGTFDELTVSYFLKGARSDRSARIAIERFRLVPRGG
jgi:hypothetical protein